MVRRLISRMKVMGPMGLLGVSLALLLAGPARADEGGKKTPATVWTVLDAKGKALGTDSVRIVRHPDGATFASGESKVGKKGARQVTRTHFQRKPDGHLFRYQRTGGGLKGSGIRLFEFNERMRYAPVNAPGKPVDLDGPVTAPIWDPGVWHLLALWRWPSDCLKGHGLPFYNAASRKTGSAQATCEQTRPVLNAKGQAVTANVWAVSGLGGDSLKVFTDQKGALVGVRSVDRQMLLEKWTWDGPATAKPSDAPPPASGAASDDEEDADEADLDEDEREEREIKERGAGP